jgi:vacuolar-type H+-ATPase subunit H
MSEMDGKVTEIAGRQFRIVKKGLDEAEVSAFISGLINRNDELANKLSHLNSLTKLAEKVVVNAEDQARIIIIETEKKADAEATTIIARAEEEARAKAEEIAAEAEEEAKAKTERIIAEAQQRAEKGAREKISLAEQQAWIIMKAAKGEVETIELSKAGGSTEIIAASSPTEEGCD